MSEKVKVLDLIEDNAALLYKLNKGGIKNINTALDYLVIYATFKTYKGIPEIMERKAVTAEHCKVSIRTVSSAIEILESKI
jgi:hypothetical protein